MWTRRYAIRIAGMAGALALAAALWPGTARAAPPPGGGGGTGGGTIYFLYVSRDQLVSMNSDGSGKTVLPIGLGAGGETGGAPEPSRLLHGHRWFLTTQFVTGAYPDGRPRAEVFAVRGDGLAQVQLTNDPNVKPLGVLRWAKDDSFASFIGVKWTGPGALDATSHIFRASVSFDASGVPSLSAVPSAVIDRGVFEWNGRTAPDFHNYIDWSPSGTKVVWVSGRGEPSGLYLEGLRVTDTVAGTTTEIASSAAEPNWSPDGSWIAFARGTTLHKIRPDGTGTKTIVNAKRYLLRPYWSPTSSHLVYQYNTTGIRMDIYRVTEGGGTKTNLTPETNDPIDDAFPVAWR